jgi:hypothetical protein
MVDLSNTNLFKVGADVGGGIGKGIGTYLETRDKENKDAETKAKIDQYVMAYNNKNDQQIFGGMEGSLRSEKLARLLLPLDPELSKQYALTANKQKSDETQLARNKEVMSAGEGISTSEQDTEATTKAQTDVEAEIKLITDELAKRRSDEMQTMKDNYKPDYSSMPPSTPYLINRYNMGNQ